MFIITNLLNYFTGKYIPPLILVLLSAGVYYWLISNYFETIVDNYVYLSVLLILMIVDIVSVVIIFGSKLFGDDVSDSVSVGVGVGTGVGTGTGTSTSVRGEGKHKIIKSNKKKSSKSVSNSNDNADNVDNEQIIDRGLDNVSIDKIDVYENNSIGSIHTYGK